MSNSTNLPPSVAELRLIIDHHVPRGPVRDAANVNLNHLCALAARAADPAPVADEAAIEKWRREAEAGGYGNNNTCSLLKSEIDEAVRLMRARLQAAEEKRDALMKAQEEWNTSFEAVDSALRKAQSDLAAMKKEAEHSTTENQRLSTKLHESSIKNDELVKERNEAIRERDELKLNREGWIHDYRDMERQAKGLEMQLCTVKDEREKAVNAIKWALGEVGDDFPVIDGPPYYRWRTQLRKMAGALLDTPQAKEVKILVCKTCNDTHRMYLEDNSVPCTRCPMPCKKCRSGGYCKTTPCNCKCHKEAIADKSESCQKDDEKEEQIAKVAIGNIQESCKELLNKIDNLSNDIDNLIKSRMSKGEDIK